MDSLRILPKSQRLDKLQINELEGFRNSNNAMFENGSLITTSIRELVIKYHKALEAAEAELKEYQAEYGIHKNDPLFKYLDEDKD